MTADEAAKIVEDDMDKRKGWTSNQKDTKWRRTWKAQAKAFKEIEGEYMAKKKEIQGEMDEVMDSAVRQGRAPNTDEWKQMKELTSRRQEVTRTACEIKDGHEQSVSEEAKRILDEANKE